MTGGAALRAVFRYFGGQPRRAAGALALMLVQTLAMLPIAGLIQQVFDRLLPARDVAGVGLALGGVLALFTLNALATVATRHVALDIIKPGIRAMRADAARNLLARERGFFAAADLDGLQTALVQDSERVDWMVTSLFTQTLPGLLVTAGLSLVLIMLNPLLFVAVAVAMGAVYAYGRVLRARTRRQVKLFHADYAAYGKVVALLLRFSELVRFRAAEAAALARLDAIVEALRRSGQRLSWMGTANSVLQNYMLSVGGVVALLIGGFEVIGGRLSIGGLLSFYIALSLLTTQARSVIGTVLIIMEGFASAEALAPYLGPPPARPSGGVPFERLREAVVLDRGRIAMGGVELIADGSLQLRRGELVGLFGASGTGKTTVANVLLGIHPLESGRVLVDGSELGTLDIGSYRRRIGVLAQAQLLFPGTIRDNLTFGLDAVAEAALDEACRRAGIADLGAMLPDGYDTELGERGARLSGGQGQRLALARAFVGEPDILILDEPDNHLDDATIGTILAGIRARGTTCLVVSHNRDLAHRFDRAYEVRDGTIMPCEAGSRDDGRPPLVSVVMPAFNAERYIGEAIASVLGQTHPHLELIVVDDGSRDGTAAVMAAFGERIVALRAAENGGIGAARNLGLAAARGAFVAFMDADDIWSPDKLARQLAAFAADPGLGLSFTHMQCFISPELPAAVKAERACPPEPLAGYVAATALVRRAVVEAVGPFDTSLRIGEFIDWFERAKAAGFRHQIDEGVLHRRRIHDSNTGVTQRRSYVDYVRVARTALRRREAAAGGDGVA